MRFSLPQSARLLVLFSPLVSMVQAVRVIVSTALEECQDNSTFSASLFNIVFTPENKSLSLNVVGDSSIEGNVTLYVKAAAYGYTFLSESLNPCTQGLSSLCPLQDLQINFDTNYNNISSNIIHRIPGIAYGIPDLDATVTVYMAKSESPNVNLACVRSRLSNGQSVYQRGVGWATAVVTVLGLLISALVSGLGYSNAGSHVAVYTLSLFNYFQAVAIIGSCAVPLPPIVQSWTQDFAWSMGIIRVKFLQTLATWYLVGTGGKPSTILATLGTKSVQVLKRSVGFVRAAHSLPRRASTDSVPTGEYTVKGLERFAFRAGMEPTNVFITGIIFFCILLLFTILGVVLFHELCRLAIRAKWMKETRFQTFRDDYRVAMKGIIFRILLIGYPQLTILSLWEFTRIDSPAEVALAVFILFGISAALTFAVFQVFQVARRSERSHKTAAYSLYANSMVFNKWGFLYIQFRASAYWYIIPTLGYILVKAMFVGLGQGSGTVQAIALVVVEASALISASVIRPWMDKPTNAINISICAINFINAILLMIFTDIFSGPGLLIGVSGVVFFVINAVFALVLLCVVLAAAAFSFLQKNPETRYQPVADNRASFIKSQTTLTTELDALGATARGDFSGSYGEKSGSDDGGHDRHDTLQPVIPFHNRSHPSTAPSTPTRPDAAFNDGRVSRGHESPMVTPRTETFPEFRAQNNNSPWQRGAGYDH